MNTSNAPSKYLDNNYIPREQHIEESTGKCDCQYSQQCYQAPSHQTSHLHENTPQCQDPERYNALLSVQIKDINIPQTSLTSKLNTKQIKFQKKKKYAVFILPHLEKNSLNFHHKTIIHPQFKPISKHSTKGRDSSFNCILSIGKKKQLYYKNRTFQE